MYEFEFFDSKKTRSADKVSFVKAKHRQEQKSTTKKAKPKSPSLVMALARSFGGTFFLAGVFKLFQDLLNFVSPQLLKYNVCRHRIFVPQVVASCMTAKAVSSWLPFHRVLSWFCGLGEGCGCSYTVFVY